jgi:hypothetical protein
VAVRGEFWLRRRIERTSALVRLCFNKLSAADATVVSPVSILGHSVSSVVGNCLDLLRRRRCSPVFQFHERTSTGDFASSPSSSARLSPSLVISPSSALTVLICSVMHLIMSVGVVVAVDRA